MTSKFDISKGQSDWQTNINGFFDANEIVANDWSTSGISFLNGFGNGDTSNASSSLKYRVLDFGGIRAIEFSGYLSNPEIASRVQVDYAKFPVSIFKGKTEVKGLFGYMSLIWGDQWLKNKIDASTGTLTVNNFTVGTSANGVVPAGKFFVDFLTFV
ncbi:hypothetical protein [Paucilactobacillus sp. N302-9]